MRDTGEVRGDVTAAWVEVLSGLGEKGPACIRLWTGREIWVLDVGVGPEATSPFHPDWLIGADRVFITHDHIDHIGGAAHAIAAILQENDHATCLSFCSPLTDTARRSSAVR